MIKRVVVILIISLFFGTLIAPVAGASITIVEEAYYQPLIPDDNRHTYVHVDNQDI
ncbi:MAG: hypothetical protein ACTSUB_09825 [Candidatus Thorarchaeota archaeon]